MENEIGRVFRDVNEEKSSIRVGFVTYDQTVHFYNLKSRSGVPKMTVVSDVQDVFTPLGDDFLVTLEEAEPVLERFEFCIFADISAELLHHETLQNPGFFASMEIC